MFSLSVIIPTFNESKNILKVINEIEASLHDLDYEIIVVDDNSPDGTATILKKISKNNDNFYYKIRENKLGLNTAHILAYDYAKENNYELIPVPIMEQEINDIVALRICTLNF